MKLAGLTRETLQLVSRGGMKMTLKTLDFLNLAVSLTRKSTILLESIELREQSSTPQSSRDLSVKKTEKLTETIPSKRSI